MLIYIKCPYCKKKILYWVVMVMKHCPECKKPLQKNGEKIKEEEEIVPSKTWLAGSLTRQETSNT